MNQQVEQLLRTLDRREFELRMGRLSLAVEVLRSETDLTERILAAGTWREDFEALSRFLSESQGSEARATKADKERLLNALSAKAGVARELAGDLTGKSEAFNRALYWWVRGRYGSGTDVYGLAKPRMAERGEVSQLIMPAERPRPTDPMTEQSDPTPRFQRRHHYSWAVGERQFSVALAREPQIQRIPILKGFR